MEALEARVAAVAAARMQMQVEAAQVAEAGCSRAEQEAAGAVLSGGSAGAEQEEASVVALAAEVRALADKAHLDELDKEWARECAWNREEGEEICYEGVDFKYRSRCELCWYKMIWIRSNKNPRCDCGRSRSEYRDCWRKARHSEDWSLTPPPWKRSTIVAKQQ